eukprot:4082533-Pyramimonas_sp.AAC.1
MPSGEVSGAAGQRQPGGLGRSGGWGALCRVGGPVGETVLPLRAGGGQARQHRGQVHHRRRAPGTTQIPIEGPRVVCGCGMFLSRDCDWSTHHPAEQTNKQTKHARGGSEDLRLHPRSSEYLTNPS